MPISRGGKKQPTDSNLAAQEASRFAEELPPILDRVSGADWYHRPGNDVDLAAYKLCHLRRARAGALGGTFHGDDAVRAVLAATSPEALVWLASRAISYMDETGFPDSVEPWIER